MHSIDRVFKNLNTYIHTIPILCNVDRQNCDAMANLLFQAVQFGFSTGQGAQECGHSLG